MPDADVTLDGQNCIVDGNWMLVRCFDIKLDAAGRRGGAGGERRALVHGFSDELVVNYADDYPGGVTIRGVVTFPGRIRQRHFRLESHDLHLDHPERRSSAGGERRALVHGFNDELVLNWARDYPGGVACHGHFDVQKAGSLRLRNNAGDVTTLLDSSGNLYLGGAGVDGDVICRNSVGSEVFHVDAQVRRMDLKDDAGSTRIRIGVDDFTGAAWPPWADGSSPSRLDLVAELRRLKEELLALKAQVAALGGGS
jgi:hypothetical protein